MFLTFCPVSDVKPNRPALVTLNNIIVCNNVKIIDSINKLWSVSFLRCS